MSCVKCPQMKGVAVCNQERSETQLHIVRGSETAKALGFSRFFLSSPIYGESLCLCYFPEFWKYPFNPTYGRILSLQGKRRWVSLGFFFHLRSMEKVCAYVTFQSFGSIRSTQPTGGYSHCPVRLGNRTYRAYAFCHDTLHITHCRRGFKPRLQRGLRKSCS